MEFKIVPHLLRFHPRLLIAIVIGVLVALLAPLPRAQAHTGVQALLGWDAFVWSYLLMLAQLMATATNERIREVAEAEDESSMMVLSLVSVAAIASVAAIVMVLATAKSGNSHVSIEHILLAGCTLVGGWFLVPTVYAIRYARLYFSDKESPRALLFPDRDVEVDYWDFLYFSFTIAVASQTSDVELGSKRMRRTGLAQSLLSFFFNLAILGLSINIAAGLVS
jgi:uncharacterized membrane protein